MDIRIAGLAAAAALTAGSAQAATVEFKDAVARVTVIPENRADIRVEIVSPNAKLPLTVTTSRDRTVVRGNVWGRLRDCGERGERAGVTVRGVGAVGYDDMPHVIVRTPQDVKVHAGGAIHGSIGRAASIDLSNSGCSHWTVADVTGEARILASGVSSIRMGEADRLNVRLSGEADVRAKGVRHGMDALLSGEGSLDVDQFRGPMQAQVSGVARIRAAGQASNLRAAVSGHGGVEFDGVAESLDASISGVGSIHVGEVRGSIRKSVSGEGRLVIGQGS